MNKYKLDNQEIVIFLIDLQEKLMNTMQDKKNVCRNSRILLEIAKQYNIPVISCEQYPKGLGQTVKEVKDYFPSNYYYLEKISFSAYTEELQKILQTIGRKNIIIAGSETHVCVFQTTRDLVNAGYNVYVAKDAVCSRFKENYENGLDLMKSLGAIITNTETILFDLARYGNTPEFKAVSSLIK